MAHPKPEDIPAQHFTISHALSTQSHPAGQTVELTLAFKTFGDSSLAPHNAVCLPSCYGGVLNDTLPFLYTAPHAIFPASKYFVIVVALLGNGESSSPSNTPAPHDGPRFPQVTYQDNITLQHALLRHLGVQKLAAYIGFSMGGQQAYHMSVVFPDFVEKAVCIAGSARTSMHNWSFLEGPKAALVNSADFHGGHYTKPATQGTGAFGRVYVTWARSPAWFKLECWRQCGCESLEEYIRENWEKGLGNWDANNLLCLLYTWQQADVGVFFPEDAGDLKKTLNRVKAKILVMPVRTDLYFTVDESEIEVQALGERGTLRVVESIWGHMSGGGGGTEEDNLFIAEEIQKFLVEV